MDWFKKFIVIIAITVQGTTAHYNNYGQENHVFISESFHYSRPPHIIMPLFYEKANFVPTTMNARAIVQSGPVQGTVSFYQPHVGAPTLIAGKFTGLSDGQYNVFITEFGDSEQSCARSGSVWNMSFNDFNYYGFPFNKPLGDLGSIMADDDDTAYIRTSHNFISLVPGHPANILGRGLAVATASENSTITPIIDACGPIFAVQSIQMDLMETNENVKK